jgi:micrococcal nuclease
MYEYNALVREVYDGDTITCDIDLGLGVWMRGQKIRLFGINAPELRGETIDAGRASRDALRDQIQSRPVTIRTIKDKTEKYGRWLGVIYVGFVNVNDWLVERGHAVKAEY